MKLPEFSVKRRVTASMIAMILVIVGFIAFSRLGLDFFPDIEFPTVSVLTVYRGASPEDIEKTITKPIEQIVSSIVRVKKVSSISAEGISVIMVEFEWGTNLDFAAQDIRDQIGLYRHQLPEAASDPLVVKFNLAQMPVIFYGITAERPTAELKKIIEDEVAPRIERLDGVASARVFSTDIREIQVNVDKAALESRNLSLDRIIAALRMENLNLPAGYVIERHADYLVRTIAEFESLEDIKRTVIGQTARGELIYLADVAEVVDGLKETRYLGRIQKEKGVFLIVNKRSGANSAQVGDRVKKELEKIQSILPSDIKFYVAMDQADMIKRVITRTFNTAWQGGLLAIFLLFLFLRNWRPTVTIALAIPLSIITTFIALYAAGYTINLLTLMGLTLGVGMLVDNAIVVIENTFRHIELGKAAIPASIIGASEVGMAITASTLTTIIVFLPVVFSTGITAKLTQALALSVAFSLVASLFVALTIVPLVSSLIFQKAGGDARPIKKQFERPKNFYRKLLTSALRHRKEVLIATGALFLISVALIPIIGTEFMPIQDSRMILLKVKLPVGTSLQETDRIVRLIEELMLRQPEVLMVSAQVGSASEEDPADMASGFAATGPHEAIIWVGLVHKEQRKRSDVRILEDIRKQLPALEKVKIESINMGQMVLGTATPVEIKIFGKEIPVLRDIADNIVRRIQDVEGLRDLTHTLAQGRPEYQIYIDRDRVARLGLTVNQVANLVQTATLGRVATRYREGGEEIDVRVWFKEKYRKNLREVLTTPLLNPLNKVVTLDQVAELKRGEGPIQITRENQARKVSVTANIVGRDIGSVTREIKARLSPIEKTLPAGYFIEYGGQYEQMQEAFKTLALAFVLAVILVYMVMASQFESFLHPFVIMFTVPLGLIGVVLGLLITGKTISLPVWIGFILLAGIAVNNGIVMIDYINQLWRRGELNKREAIIEGAVTRLRPVLLTALTTILGLLPMAISRTTGSEMRSPLAITVLSGLTATTLLTLFIIPIIYSLLEKVSFKEIEIKTQK
ncbi:MAG: efflux RND transporter permease subunit [Candidatus Aminicenantes bacterium]|nr:efflux RND transporter permease subunit [Candidatus Aminicenantes bacterium]